MRQERRAGPLLSKAARATLILVLVLFGAGCQPAPSPAPTIQVAPTQPAAPAIRTELAATDPATVNLASGNPTLVEFFAFW